MKSFSDWSFTENCLEGKLVVLQCSTFLLPRPWIWLTCDCMGSKHESGSQVGFGFPTGGVPDRFGVPEKNEKMIVQWKTGERH